MKKGDRGWEGEDTIRNELQYVNVIKVHVITIMSQQKESSVIMESEVGSGPFHNGSNA